MITYYLLQNAKSGPMKLLGDSLRQNPKSIVTTSFEAAENVRKHNFVYLGVIVLQINQKRFHQYHYKYLPSYKIIEYDLSFDNDTDIDLYI